jgi:hypothetical protein
MFYIQASFPALSIKFYLNVVALQIRDLKLPVKPQWKLHIPPGIILKLDAFVCVFFSVNLRTSSVCFVQWTVFGNLYAIFYFYLYTGCIFYSVFTNSQQMHFWEFYCFIPPLLHISAQARHRQGAFLCLLSYFKTCEFYGIQWLIKL